MWQRIMKHTGGDATAVLELAGWILGIFSYIERSGAEWRALWCGVSTSYPTTTQQLHNNLHNNVHNNLHNNSISFEKTTKTKSTNQTKIHAPFDEIPRPHVVCKLLGCFELLCRLLCRLLCKLLCSCCVVVV